MGDTIPEIDLKIAATKYNYNYELALNSVLSSEQIIMDDKSSDTRAKKDKKPNNGSQQKKGKPLALNRSFSECFVGGFYLEAFKKIDLYDFD